MKVTGYGSTPTATAIGIVTLPIEKERSMKRLMPRMFRSESVPRKIPLSTRNTRCRRSL